MEDHIHDTITNVAGLISKPMQKDISDIGHIDFPNRPEPSLGFYISKVVVSQQLSIKAAHSIWKRVEIAAASQNSDIPDYFSEKSIPTLQKCGVSGNKIRALCSISNNAKDGGLDDTTYKQLSHEERALNLTQLWGVGAWTCDMISIFYFKELDIWPSGDLSATKKFHSYVDESAKMPVEKALTMFTPYRSLLALYMWKILDSQTS
jgi:DNA-3-methyladenine glycosylase II